MKKAKSKQENKKRKNTLSSKKKDLKPGMLSDRLIWNDEKAFDSLEKIYEFVNQECTRAIEWYFEARKHKKVLGYGLRVGTIFAFAISGLVPILSEIHKTNEPCHFGMIHAVKK